MKVQTARTVTFNEKHTFVPLGDTFKFRSDLKHHWLQKICFYMLSKLKAFALKENVEIRDRYINAESFMERFYKASGEMSRVFDLHPTVLLIGLTDYKELMFEMYSARDRFSFQAEYAFYTMGKRPKVMNLTVHVVPWMHGHVLLTARELRHEASK